MKFFQIENRIINIDEIVYFDDKVITFTNGEYMRIYSGIFIDLKEFIFNSENKEVQK